MPAHALLSTRATTLRWLVLAASLAAMAAGVRAQAHVSLKGSAASAGSVAPATAPLTRPTWNDLTSRQRTALAPLAPHWDGLSENHKRKWIAISRNYDDWSPAEQEKMHGRMSDWAGLSTSERDQARLNYAETRKLSADEKKERWEAYQALSEEQRGKLASTVAPKRPGVAAPARIARAPELVKLVPAGGNPKTLPRVGMPASEVDHNTLLPQHTQ